MHKKKTRTALDYLNDIMEEINDVRDFMGPMDMPAFSRDLMTLGGCNAVHPEHRRSDKKYPPGYQRTAFQYSLEEVHRYPEQISVSVLRGRAGRSLERRKE